MIIDTARHLLVPVTVGATLLLGACASSETAEEDTTAQAQTSTDRTEGTQAALLTITDPWVKAAGADDGMTAAFGVLINEGEAQADIVAAYAEEISDMVELHEVVSGDDGNMVMQEKEGGFSVAAGGEHELAPGADHIMIMGLSKDLEPGTEVALTLEFEDGSTREFTAPVKDFEGANENYHEDH